MLDTENTRKASPSGAPNRTRVRTCPEYETPEKSLADLEVLSGGVLTERVGTCAVRGPIPAMRGLAISKIRSLRTTVPIYVARQLGLEPGFRVKWDMDKVKGSWIATICKAGDK